MCLLSERCRGNLDIIARLCSSSCESGQRCHRLNNLASTNSLHTWRVLCPVVQFGKAAKFMNLSSYVKSKLKLAVCMSNYNLKRRFSKFTFFIDICQSFLIPALLGGSQIITALLHLEKYPPTNHNTAILVVGTYYKIIHRWFCDLWDKWDYYDSKEMHFQRC